MGHSKGSSGNAGTCAGLSTCYESEDNSFVGSARGHPDGRLRPLFAGWRKALTGLRVSDNGHKLRGAANQLFTNKRRLNRQWRRRLKKPEDGKQSAGDRGGCLGCDALTKSTQGSSHIGARGCAWF